MRKVQLIVFCVSVLFCGCLKVSDKPGSSALNIVNAITYCNPIVTNFTQTNGKGQFISALQSYSTANQIPFTGYWESGSYTGSTQISISQITDTSQTIWSGRLTLPVGRIQSLYFCGDTTQVDTLLTIDQIPSYLPADSLAGLRIVNLLHGSLPLTINVSGNSPTQAEFSNLAYKGFTNFKAYVANSNVPGFYSFEVRDQATDSLLGTFTWSYAMQKSNTVVLCGSQSTGLITFQMNNF